MEMDLNSTAIIWNVVFLVFYFHRYIRLWVHTWAHWTHKSIPLPVKPTLTEADVTVVIPTIESNVEKLRAPLQSILACKPFELILISTVDLYPSLCKFVESLENSRVKIYHCAIANKRLQLREAIPLIKTQVTVLVDDDVTWPSTIIPWLLAPLEQPSMGSVGVCQRATRIRTGSWATMCWNWEGMDYIERRNFEISATHRMDGGTSCMSGRTNALRTEIIQDPLFLHGFCTERWGKYHLNADDDNFITRWIVNHAWKTWIQYEKECEIETTLENNSMFLSQCLRWARSNWRSNFTTLFVERVVWSTQRWSVYGVYTATFLSCGLVTDPLQFYLYAMATASWEVAHRQQGWVFVIAMYIFSKVIKRVGLLRRYPSDVIFLPVSILFGLFHGFIKIHALLTWNVTSWGTRADSDVDDNVRMLAVPLADVMSNPGAKSQRLVRYTDEVSFHDKEDETREKQSELDLKPQLIDYTSDMSEPVSTDPEKST